MHPKLIQVAKVMARWPVVGPCIRFAAKFIRRGPPPPPAAISAPDTQDNLLQSVPVSLRHLKRELQAVRAQLSVLTRALQASQASPTNPTNQASAALKDSATPISPVAVQVLNADKLATARINGLRLAFGTDLTPGHTVKAGNGMSRGNGTNVGDGSNRSNRSNRNNVTNDGNAGAQNTIVIHDSASIGVDIVSSTWDLPFEHGLAESITVGEWLQRHSTEELNHTVLPTLFRLLAPGGQLEVRVLDASALLKNTKANFQSLSGKAQDSHGTHDASGSQVSPETLEPQTLFTRESLRGLLANAGFTNVAVTAIPSTATLQAFASKPQ